VLRQIARLGRPVTGLGTGALALAVYSDATNTAVAAREAGFEGVACVDDAARGLELYCDLWEATRLPWALRWCEGLLEFVLAMQDEDGRWVNFIVDWDGTANRDARTSVAGGVFWQARALLALARASRVLDDARIESALHRGLPHIADAEAPPDVRVLHIMTALALPDRADDGGIGRLLATWCDEVAGCRRGGMLMNAPLERGHPHLWGHLQEAALADAGARLGRDDLVDTARRSAELVFAGIVEAGFDMPRTQPYDVASAVHVLGRVAEVTGDSRYAALAAAARGWFDGRNPTGRPVYDRVAGRVGDGVDGHRVSGNSGAESNVVGAQALLDDVVALARRLSPAEALPAGA
jgi:hypothetical protein